MGKLLLFGWYCWYCQITITGQFNKSILLVGRTLGIEASIYPMVTHSEHIFVFTYSSDRVRGRSRLNHMDGMLQKDSWIQEMAPLSLSSSFSRLGVINSSQISADGIDYLSTCLVQNADVMLLSFFVVEKSLLFEYFCQITTFLLAIYWIPLPLPPQEIWESQNNGYIYIQVMFVRFSFASTSDITLLLI